MPTITNNRSGESITTTMATHEAAALVAQNIDDNHWLAFWLHKLANEMAAEGGPEPFGEAMETIACMFLYSIGMGLKRPRIRVAYGDTRYTMYLSKRGTLCMRAAERRVPGQNVWHENYYLGCIYNGRLRADNVPNHCQNFLDRLADEDDLTGFLAQCSKDLGACCYCNQGLDHAYSKAVGYGEICAKRWGLPWGKDAHDEKSPHIFRLLANHDLRAMMARVREYPTDATEWAVLSDWLEENGLNRLTMPGSGITLPR